MKKIILSVLAFVMLNSSANANYYFIVENVDKEIANSFVNSPSYYDLENISDPIERYCEETFLRKYRREEFNDFENLICSNVFARKIEAELAYKINVLYNRWVY